MEDDEAGAIDLTDITGPEGITVEAPEGVQGDDYESGDAGIFGDDEASAETAFGLDLSTTTGGHGAAGGGLGAGTSMSLQNLNATFQLMKNLGVIQTEPGQPITIPNFLQQVKAVQSLIDKYGAPGFMQAFPNITPEMFNVMMQQVTSLAPPNPGVSSYVQAPYSIDPRYEELANIPLSQQGLNSTYPGTDFTLGFNPATGFAGGPTGTVTVDNTGTNTGTTTTTGTDTGTTGTNTGTTTATGTDTGTTGTTTGTDIGTTAADFGTSIADPSAFSDIDTSGQPPRPYFDPTAFGMNGADQMPPQMSGRDAIAQAMMGGPPPGMPPVDGSDPYSGAASVGLANQTQNNIDQYLANPSSLPQDTPINPIFQQPPNTSVPDWLRQHPEWAQA